MKVCIYLRKSRADLEAESRGEGETLSKHRKTLLKVAKEMNLNVIKIREEIVSGESLMHRPEMLELMKEIGDGKYDAVLVMDVDRLGRGNMQEQGLILETLKQSGTKIITPRKTYNLDDEWDEEYSEFEAFMARKELKMINRRLQRGRIRSIEDGNYIATAPPYGYEIFEAKEFRTLRPHPEQSEVVQLIFGLYVEDHLGSTTIAKKLNELGYTSTTGIKWSNHAVINVLKNITYTGKVVWKKKEIKKSKDPTKVKDTRTRPKNEWIIVEGRHEAIIDENTFKKAQSIMSNRAHVPAPRNKINNPLAGLVKCGKCGGSIVLRPYPKIDDRVICYKHCGMRTTKFKLVEESLLKALQDWLHQYELKMAGLKNETSNISIYERAVQQLEKELAELEKQKVNLHDLLERGVYDVDTFLDRSKNLSDRIDQATRNITKAKDELEKEKAKTKAKNNIIPQLKRVLEGYYKTDDPALKNRLLKSVLDSATYDRPVDAREDEFTLEISPKLPK